MPVPAGAVTGNVAVTVGGRSSNGYGFTVIDLGAEHHAGESWLRSRGHASDDLGGELRGDAGREHGHVRGSTSHTDELERGEHHALVPAGAVTGNVVVTVGGQASNGFSFTVGQTTINWNSVEQRIDGFGASAIDAGESGTVSLSSAQADFFFANAGSNLGFSLLRVEIIPSVADCDSWTASEGLGTGRCIPKFECDNISGRVDRRPGRCCQRSECVGDAVLADRLLLRATVFSIRVERF